MEDLLPPELWCLVLSYFDHEDIDRIRKPFKNILKGNYLYIKGLTKYREFDLTPSEVELLKIMEDTEPSDPKTLFPSTEMLIENINIRYFDTVLRFIAKNRGVSILSLKYWIDPHSSGLPKYRWTEDRIRKYFHLDKNDPTNSEVIYLLNHRFSYFRMSMGLDENYIDTVDRFLLESPDLGKLKMIVIPESLDGLSLRREPFASLIYAVRDKLGLSSLIGFNSNSYKYCNIDIVAKNITFFKKYRELQFERTPTIKYNVPDIPIATVSKNDLYETMLNLQEGDNRNILYISRTESEKVLFPKSRFTIWRTRRRKETRDYEVGFLNIDTEKPRKRGVVFVIAMSTLACAELSILQDLFKKTFDGIVIGDINYTEHTQVIVFNTIFDYVKKSKGLCKVWSVNSDKHWMTRVLAYRRLIQEDPTDNRLRYLVYNKTDSTTKKYQNVINSLLEIYDFDAEAMIKDHRVFKILRNIYKIEGKLYKNRF